VNVQSTIKRPEALKLNVDAFLVLRRAGAFADLVKSELLEGELWGVVREPDPDLQSDRMAPIKLRVSDYHLLEKAGCFDGRAKTELIDGLLYSMSPQFRPHGYLKDELAYRLRRALEDAASDMHVATEQSVRVTDHSQPQPDIILTSEPRGDGAIPIETVALLVEVSATTLEFDLVHKMALYASAGVPEYWVADVVARVIHQHWSPDDGCYSQSRRIAFGAPIAAATIADLAIATTAL
jgi:Uma2 family endonuclease